jgi:hypothetical protein
MMKMTRSKGTSRIENRVTACEPTACSDSQSKPSNQATYLSQEASRRRQRCGTRRTSSNRDHGQQMLFIENANFHIDYTVSVNQTRVDGKREALCSLIFDCDDVLLCVTLTHKT